MIPLGPRLLSWGRNAPNSLFNWPRSRGAFFVGQVGTVRYHIDDAIRVVQSGKARYVHASREGFVRGASREDVAVVYLLRSAQYQFCNCGVL